MKFNKLVMSVAAMAVVSSGFGSDLRPAVISKKNSRNLADTVLNGRAGTAMPPFKEKFSKNFSKNIQKLQMLRKIQISVS